MHPIVSLSCYLAAPSPCMEHRALSSCRRIASARVDAPAIHQNGAGTTLTLVATFLRPSQIQMLTKRVEQGRSRID